MPPADPSPETPATAGALPSWLYAAASVAVDAAVAAAAAVDDAGCTLRPPVISPATAVVVDVGVAEVAAAAAAENGSDGGASVTDVAVMAVMKEAAEVAGKDEAN